jgi:hypothetical protein
MLRHAVFAALGVLALTGCAALAPDWPSTPEVSKETLDLSPPAAATVAEDLARRVRQHFGPAQTALAMPHPDRPLGHALEDALRRAGYAVHTDGPDVTKEATGVRVTYLVDGFAPDQVLVRLRVGTDFQLARVYATQSERAVPADAFTLAHPEVSKHEVSRHGVSKHLSPPEVAKGEGEAASP